MGNGNSELLHEGAARLGIILTREQVAIFGQYLKELSLWQAHMNLIRRKNERDVILKDFIDSMTIIKYLPLKTFLADLGSGAGLPGIPVKIVRSDIRVSLLESTQKKVFFLNNVIRMLGLQGIGVRGPGKLTEQEKETWGEFDFIVCRAFGTLTRISSAGGPLLKKGGILLAMKGKKGKEELAENLPFLERMGWKRAFVDQMRLPFLDHERTLIGLQKK